MSEKPPIKVLFVCMGNICRSPTAHGVFQSIVDKEGLAQLIRADSAGTHSYHIGSPPDLRSQALARSRGVELGYLKARRFEASDFVEFDYLLGMDNNNITHMLAVKPDNASARINLMLDFAKTFEQKEVPDPYFGNDGFDLVYDMIEDGATGLLEEIRREHKI